MTIHLWYTDDALTDFIKNKAVAFYEQNDIRVETKLVSGLEYLEQINRDSLSTEEAGPDVFVISNDSLEKAYLAGLTTNISGGIETLEQAGYSQTAIDAVTYNGKCIGIPFYYETAALLYNKTYLEQIVQNNNEAVSEDENATIISADDLIPSSIADILNFADSYSTPENVEYFFRWDVSDIFYNYFFIGNYISVGGNAGDRKDEINIYNTDAIVSLKVYQQMSQFFSIDAKEINYEKVMAQFLEGKTIYTIATSDCIATLEAAKKNGEFEYEYGIATLPNINNELETKGMSVTNALVINGYSGHKDASERFIRFLSDEAGNDLYNFAGKLPAKVGQAYENENLLAFHPMMAFVSGIDADCGISHYGLRTGGCDDELLIGVLYGVSDIPEAARHILILDLRVG